MVQLLQLCNIHSGLRHQVLRLKTFLTALVIQDLQGTWRSQDTSTGILCTDFGQAVPLSLMVLVFGKPAAGLEGCPVCHAPTAFTLLQDSADRVSESSTAQVCLAAGPVAVLLIVLTTVPEATICCRASEQVSFQ